MIHKFQSVKGTKDLLPTETPRWRELEETVHKFISRWGYLEIRTPAFEPTELFVRSSGEGSDIVTKQMYTFEDQSQTSITLKPELTAPVIRAYIQHNLAKQGGTTKLYYIDSLYRQERPQAGRLRQFHQFGVEAIGSSNPEQDAEVIALAYLILLDLGIEDLELYLNSIGSVETRKRYRKILSGYFLEHEHQLSNVSRERLHKNPLRILDTKDKKEQTLLSNAPKIYDYLTQDDQDHYEAVKHHLTELEIPFIQHDLLVRGLDYYTRTTFEITSSKLGAQNALCGGGRYDNLVESLGGPPTPAIGFAAGIERILMAQKDTRTGEDKPDRIYVVCATENARDFVLKLTMDLRKQGLPVEFDALRRSLKAQMRDANRLKCTFAVIIGEKELDSETIQLKNLTTSEQKTVQLGTLITYLTKELKL
ncbi:MAG: histidine--tRNA ligase [Candidatus Marinimicrobia bacterium]|nr:histidine--tRNA ligase [Candidatus Neomarinimicrobiota bacterium]